jgi:hypothetical protein
MPKRTNYRQKIIELLESMNAGPGCTVTPSKFLRDIHSGIEREVDVVVERLVDRETSTWSFEVLAENRRADVQWVDRMIGKHETLPTEKLFLVSWSGFTGGARKQAATKPRVALCTPDIVSGGDGPRIKTIRVGSIQMTPTETRIGFNRPDGSKGWIRSEPDIGLYTAAMEPVGPAQQLTEMLLRDPRVGPLARENASVHPERDDLKFFDLYAPIENANLNLYEQDLVELQHITLIEVLGDFHFEEKRLDMEVRELRGQPFAYGTVELAGANAALVTRLDEAFEVSAGIARFEPVEPKDGERQRAAD